MIYLLELVNYPIYHQLQLEEALLRVGDKSICLLNIGTPTSIIMGVSGKPEELIDLEKAGQENITIIRRFTGGGCVVADENTLFVTFIFSKGFLPLSFFPEPILHWTETFYRSAFALPHFTVSENDYTLDGFKCGGNAQYITKDKFLHHTTFLWDYHPKKMNLLYLPRKRPKYRQDRNHSEFLYTLKNLFFSKEMVFKKIKGELSKQFSVKNFPLEEALSYIRIPHRQSTKLLEKK